MGILLKNPPVFHTLVQINFTPIPTIKDRIDKIHEEFRQNSFDEIKKEVQQEVTIQGPDNSQGMRVEHNNKFLWHFINFECDAGFLLGDNFLTFHTTNHTNFENFKQNILKGLDILNQIVNPTIVNSIGLRYLDAIIPQKDENIDEYLITEVLGFKNIPLNEDNFDIQHSMFETILNDRINNKTCVARVVLTALDNSPPIMPQELAPLIQHLKLKPAFTNISASMALLDLDCVKRGIREKSDSKNIDSYLEDLHSNAATVFRSLINNKRWEEWTA